MVVLNGRLSARSHRGYRRIRTLLAPTLRRIDLVAAQTDEIADRFRSLGVPGERVVVTGSVKYDGVELDRANPKTAHLRRRLGLSASELALVAGSTMEGEDEAALGVYRAAVAQGHRLRLILVPRHPERSADVARLVERAGETVVRLTEPVRLGPKASDRARPSVLLIDAMGELGAAWGLADIAFVGGSLFPGRNGQNVMEPAAMGASVLFGPHTSNFREATEGLLERDAARCVRDASELAAALVADLDDPTSASRRGEAARAFVLAQQGATERTLGLLEKLEKGDVRRKQSAFCIPFSSFPEISTVSSAACSHSPGGHEVNSKSSILTIWLCCSISFAFADDRPNIVWIFGEDMGPELGCYGDVNAITPNIDRLAQQGARFTRCFTHAPVCAPSRSGLITGRYPTSIGSHHMRSTLLNPPPMFTEYLRKAGYVVAWPTKTPFGKTDFNFALPTNAFDRTDDWTKNIPKQPFFGFFNMTTSHESQIRATADKFAQNTARLKPSDRRDPAKMLLPAYYPDTAAVRRDLANYYDLVTAVDYKVGEVLDSLDRAGIADNTVVILAGDHGRGLPRSKRWVYNQGIHVPLLVRWPGMIKPGSIREDLVCFLDFAATTLALAGAEIPKELQGQVMLGPRTAPERKYIFAARDRMDETYDRIRTVREIRFQYIRNFHPELPYAQRISYMEEMPTMQAWRRLNAEGKLTGPQILFFTATKPAEELYDVEADPDEIHNLADDPRYRDKLQELRDALDSWMKETNDLGGIPESELIKSGLVADRLAEYETRKVKSP